MNCERAEELINLYIDDALEPSQAGVMFAHLAGCPACQRVLSSSLRVRAAVTSEIQPTAPDAIEKSIFARIEGAGRSRPDMWSIRISIPLPAAMAMAVVLVIGSMLASPIFLERQPAAQSADETLQQLPDAVQSQVRLTQFLLGK